MRALIGLLDLEGRTVTADAMHCQIETAQAPLDGRADYLLTLKSDRFSMYDDAQLFMDDPAVVAASAAQSVDADHGRIETRRARVVTGFAWPAGRHGFPGARSARSSPRARTAGARRSKAGVCSPCPPP